MNNLEWAPKPVKKETMACNVINKCEIYIPRYLFKSVAGIGDNGHVVGDVSDSKRR